MTTSFTLDDALTRVVDVARRALQSERAATPDTIALAIVTYYLRRDHKAAGSASLGAPASEITECQSRP